MDVLSWLWWLVQILFGFVWLLIGGWVSTLLQIVVLALGIFVWRHGWRQAPHELWRQAIAFYRFLGGAMRASAAMESARAPEPRRASPSPAAPLQPRRQFGDVTINLSGALSALMFIGFAAAALFKV